MCVTAGARDSSSAPLTRLNLGVLPFFPPARFSEKLAYWAVTRNAERAFESRLVAV